MNDKVLSARYFKVPFDKESYIIKDHVGLIPNSVIIRIRNIHGLIIFDDITLIKKTNSDSSLELPSDNPDHLVMWMNYCIGTYNTINGRLVVNLKDVSDSHNPNRLCTIDVRFVKDTK